MGNIRMQLDNYVPVDWSKTMMVDYHRAINMKILIYISHPWFHVHVTRNQNILSLVMLSVEWLCNELLFPGKTNLPLIPYHQDPNYRTAWMWRYFDKQVWWSFVSKLLCVKHIGWGS